MAIAMPPERTAGLQCSSVCWPVLLVPPQAAWLLAASMTPHVVGPQRDTWHIAAGRPQWDWKVCRKGGKRRTEEEGEAATLGYGRLGGRQGDMMETRLERRGHECSGNGTART